MKHFLIDVGEGLVFGVAFAVLIRLLGIDVTPAQMGILAGFAIIAIAALNAIGTRLKGGQSSEALPDKQMKYEYGDKTILVQYRGTKIMLLVNGEMQDMLNVVASFKALTLTGKLPTGEEVKAVAGKGVNKWNVFVGQEEVQQV